MRTICVDDAIGVSKSYIQDVLSRPPNITKFEIH